MNLVVADASPVHYLIIALALELKAPVLLDEKEARQIARNKGILVIGTVGIIERAADMNLLDIRKTLTELRRTNAHISDSIIDYAIRRNAQRMLPTKPPPPTGPDARA